MPQCPARVGTLRPPSLFPAYDSHWRRLACSARVQRSTRPTRRLSSTARNSGPRLAAHMQAAAAASGEQAAAPAEPRLLCSNFLGSSTAPASSDKHLAVVLLNWTLPALTPRLWQTAALRICADGGANRLFDELPHMLPGQAAEAVRAQYTPTAILGDLDSIRPDVRHFYQEQGVAVEDLSADQDSTDLQKCIHFVLRQAEEQRIELQHLTVVALGALGGRLDHSLSSLSTLHAHRDLNLVLLGDGNLARLAPAGHCVIRPDRQVEGPSCGLIPLTGPAVASSSGLRWDMDKLELHIGGLISTSNIIEADEIQVETDTDLVWTTQLSGSR